MKIEINDKTIEIQPKKKNHPGFVDAHGQTLEPGDEIIVTDNYRSFHAVITRFTPRRIYWRLLTVPSTIHPFYKDYENCTQLHYWYGPERRGPGGEVIDAEPTNQFKRVIKLEAL